MTIYLFIRMCMCPSVCIYDYLSIYSYVYASTWLYMRLPGCICVYLAVYASTWLYMRLPGSICVYLAVYASTWLYMRLPGCICVYLAIAQTINSFCAECRVCLSSSLPESGRNHFQRTVYMQYVCLTTIKRVTALLRIWRGCAVAQPINSLCAFFVFCQRLDASRLRKLAFSAVAKLRKRYLSFAQITRSIQPLHCLTQAEIAFNALYVVCRV